MGMTLQEVSILTSLDTLIASCLALWSARAGRMTTVAKQNFGKAYLEFEQKFGQEDLRVWLPESYNKASNVLRLARW